jgi:enoyl-CoA hydratase/carnithine racemase
MGSALPTYDTLLTQRHDPATLVVTLNRPERLNALSFQMFDELMDVCDRIEGDDSVRAVVVTGTGRGFCSGLDLNAARALADMSPLEFLKGQETWSGTALALASLTTPVIAAVNGPASGAGMSLALACDLRVASELATFNAAFIRIGLSGGDMGSSYFLPRLVGVGAASELLLTGRFVDADESVRIGLVNQTVPADRLLPAALDLAAQIAANSPLGVRLTKQAIAANAGAGSLIAALELENRNQALTARSNDMLEALNAFIERRKPEFTGT